MPQSDLGLIAAWILDGKGGGQEIGWDEVDAWSPAAGVLWTHLDYSAGPAQEWLQQRSGLDPMVSEGLLAEETRPRSIFIGGGLLVTLRGVNMNPGSDPEDMVAIRLWSDGQRIVSTRKRRLLTATDMACALREGHGPQTAGQFLASIADMMMERMADVIDSIDDTVDDLETQVLTQQSHQLRPRIADLRREAIGLRRYLAPQREALARLHIETVDWLSDVDRIRLREVADRAMRYIEDLDSARERAVVTQEELMSRISEQMDRRMYLLSIIAAIFLPLGFLTGLLGVNVGGIPGASYPGAFLLFIFLLVCVVMLQITIFKWKRWM